MLSCLFLFDSILNRNRDELLEFNIYIAGIGGQGIQLMGKVFALAALAERRHILLAAEYGFTMRGGSSLATLVIGARPLRALPVIARADAMMVLHHQYLDAPFSRLRPGGLVVTDRLLEDKLPALPGRRVEFVEAAQTAREIGSSMVAGLALLAAFSSITGLVRTESLVAAMKELVPSYRQQHVAANERAIRQGAALAGQLFPVDLDAAAQSHAA